MKKKSSLYIIIFLLAQSLFGQDRCTYIEILLTDFKSNNLIIFDSREFLYSAMGVPNKIYSEDDKSIVDSVTYENGKNIYHYSSIDIEYLEYNGMQYICYNDSVQLTVVDFTKNNAMLYFGDICFSKNLDLDTLLKMCNYGVDCISRYWDWYYGTYAEMYQISFISKIFPISGFLFYFDIDTRKLWYASFSFNKVGGIVR